MDVELWEPRGTDQLHCRTHDATFDKGDTCADCLRGHARDSTVSFTEKLERDLLATDRLLQAHLDAICAEARACADLRKRIVAPPAKAKRGEKAPKRLKAGECLAAAQASKAAVAAYRAAIDETRRRREDLEAELYRALERRAGEHVGVEH